ncbi:glycoside hydrolase family 3 N-terminal domain-containing protein [Galbitalea soli]|uniref:Glycoside hydrolase family 3 protein n=1 Tax=Galbitalea soli TaxID=1268042 RepID=A0A7C9PL58_9MICO|nr:glycoside hydrolase family 3 N-terminal domain-containing protein [Galbitalea soli]NEM89811.1 glycoside hydrolase family 3 protein [Galbitalea soli]NYJ30515.1 beta-N-acetylhexosaminidase [Galbitalea soli]
MARPTRPPTARLTAAGHHPRARALASAVLLGTLLAGCTLPAPLPGQGSPGPGPSPSSGPHPAPSPTPTVDPIVAAAQARLAAMTVRERVASLFMFHLRGASAAALRAFATQTGAGGLILMGDNIPDPVTRLAAEVRGVSPDAALPLLTAVDQEGGSVRRIPGDDGAAGHALAALPVAATRSAFAARGALVASMGIAINFGVIADVTDDPRSFIFPRTLGSTPAQAAARVTAAVDGEGTRVLTTLKHFPGHGAFEADSHSTIPRSNRSLAVWRTHDAVPFEAGIAAGAPIVMFGHLRYDAVDPLPATLSPRWHRILRDELGFHGITITDDMIMLQHSGDPRYRDPGRNAVAALAAGNTMLLYVLQPDSAAAGDDPARLVDAVVAAVADGSLPQSTVDADALLLLEARLRLATARG